MDNREELRELREELENVRKELETLRQQLEKKEKENSRNKDKIKIHEYILANLGLDIDKINQFENKISLYRQRNRRDLLSSDTNEQDYAIRNMQDMVSEFALELVCGNVGDNVERFEEILKGVFDNVWDFLDENSKSFLISAKVMFASINKNDKYGLLDYSGVCLLVTKALELESSRVFFREYIKYLRNQKISISEYPKELIDKTGTTVKSDCLFSLGAVVHVLGLKKGRNGIQIPKEKNSDYLMFFKYAKQKLYDWSDEKIENEILKNACFIERTRLDYRNPSAHTGRLTKIVCLECFDYIVDTEKQMKRMLENMNKRNSMLS